MCLKTHPSHFPIISGGFITCGQKELLNGQFYSIIGYPDISNRRRNLSVSFVSGPLITELIIPENLPPAEKNVQSLVAVN